MNLKKRTNGSWVDTSCYIHKTATDTFTNLPATLYPTGATSTVELKGNTVQSGTPSPDNPIMPQGTGERTGNVFDKTTLENGIYLAANGNKYGNVTNGVRAGAKIKAFSNTAYTLSVQSSANVSLRIFEWSNGTFIKQTPKYNISGNASLTVTTDAETTEIAFNIEGENGQYATNIMLNSGSTALPYEPYGYKIPISSANTTTNIYLGEVETTRRIRKLVLTGQENWGKDINRDDLDDYFYTDVINDMLWNVTPISSHFIQGGINVINSVWVGGVSKPRIVLEISKTFTGIISTDDRAARIDKFKTYLQQQYANGTPVTAWYVLATEETAVVNKPLMKIGDYADIVSDISVPVTAGGDTISVDATVQPSGVAINYKGWHNAKCKEYSYNMTIADWESASISQMENHTIQELQGGNWV